MNILVMIAIAIVLPILVIVGLAWTKPGSFSVQRSARIKAPPEKVFALINNLPSWVAWSPYLKDPAMKTSYRGPAAGPGAVYSWAGNKDVGEGSVEIVEAKEPSQIAINLDILKPFEGHNRVTFSLVPVNGGATEVTWAIQGPSPLMARIVGLFMDMDKMIGADFERGLTNLKSVAERP